MTVLTERTTFLTVVAPAMAGRRRLAWPAFYAGIAIYGPTVPWEAELPKRPILNTPLLLLTKVNDARGPTCPVKANRLRHDSCAGVLFPFQR